jgi:hypothetical protein
MRERPAIGVAILVTPIAPGTVLALGGVLVDPSSSWAAIPIILVAYNVSLPLVALIGLPVFLVLRRTKWLRWWVSLLVGYPLGLAMSFAVLPTAEAGWKHLLFGFLGSISAFVFWLTWRKLTTEFTLDPKATEIES